MLLTLSGVVERCFKISRRHSYTLDEHIFITLIQGSNFSAELVKIDYNPAQTAFSLGLI